MGNAGQETRKTRKKGTKTYSAALNKKKILPKCSLNKLAKILYRAQVHSHTHTHTKTPTNLFFNKFISAEGKFKWSNVCTKREGGQNMKQNLSFKKMAKQKASLISSVINHHCLKRKKNPTCLKSCSHFP